MLTIKKQAWNGLSLFTLALVVVAGGCRPSGQELVLEGKHLLERGRTVTAIRKLEAATEHMPSNAIAWGYLGLAHHQDGAPSAAIDAYSRSISLNPRLAETRFNLGCLWLEQQDWVRASEHLVAATTLRPDMAVAWRCLGEAQIHLKDYAGATTSLGRAVELEPDQADAWNWLGMAQLQTGHPRQAAQSLVTALKHRANHGPALLNLAIILDTRLQQPEQASELYRRYLAFHPNASNAAEVRHLVQALEEQPPSLPSSAKPGPALVAQTAPQPPVVAPGPVETSQAVSRSEAQAAADRIRAFAREPVVNTPPPQPISTQPNKAPGPALVEVSPPETSEPDRATSSLSTREPAQAAAVGDDSGVEVVSVPSAGAARSSEPVIARADPDPPRMTRPQAERREPVQRESAALPVETVVQEPMETEMERGFFARLNPMNLFRRRSGEQEADLSSAVQAPNDRSLADARRGTPSVARYGYPLTQAPQPGDEARGAAEYWKAERLRSAGESEAALRAYAAAVQADPSHFGAQFQLGALSLEKGDFPRALRACETACLLAPDSRAARYNLALALKSAGYAPDAADQLLVVLEQAPRDTQVLLTLGNLYRSDLEDPAKASDCYNRLLQLDPQHPQAAAIHRWMLQNSQ